MNSPVGSGAGAALVAEVAELAVQIGDGAEVLGPERVPAVGRPAA